MVRGLLLSGECIADASYCDQGSVFPSRKGKVN